MLQSYMQKVDLKEGQSILDLGYLGAFEIESNPLC